MHVRIECVAREIRGDKVHNTSIKSSLYNEALSNSTRRIKCFNDGILVPEGVPQGVNTFIVGGYRVHILRRWAGAFLSTNTRDMKPGVLQRRYECMTQSAGCLKS